MQPVTVSGGDRVRADPCADNQNGGLVPAPVRHVFMTFAWYGHLKYRSSPLVPAIGVRNGVGCRFWRTVPDRLYSKREPPSAAHRQRSSDEHRARVACPGRRVQHGVRGGQRVRASRVIPFRARPRDQLARGRRCRCAFTGPLGSSSPSFAVASLAGRVVRCPRPSSRMEGPLLRATCRVAGGDSGDASRTADRISTTRLPSGDSNLKW